MMVASCCLALLRSSFLQAADSPAPTFETHIRPLFKVHCFDCHGEGEKLRGGLDLRVRRLAAKGGDSGPALVAGKAEESVLYRRIRDQEMPPGKKKLSAQEVELIGRWIRNGARTERAEPETIAAGMQITAEDRAFWAFQAIRRPAPPIVKGTDRLRTPIDAFLLAKLEPQGLSFAPEADRRTLIRRATFDLLGLPPTPEEVEAFVSDQSPNAFEKLIDRLLASPHHGERWGRHWLDVAGYADSEGYTQEDLPRPHAWKYRDYVIRSFNADKPFDEFVLEQLAGDEIVGASQTNPQAALRDPQSLEKLIATGFLRMAPDGTGVPGVDQKAARNQVVADTIKIISSSFLGLTVDCAQCHNHRYDPIPQSDYYRLRAILEPAYDVKNWRVPAARRISLYTSADREKAATVEAEAAGIDRQRLAKQQEFIEATFNKELLKLPEAIRDRVRTARNTAEAKRTAEQQLLLKEHPSVNVTAGSLYLYDSKAAAELKKLADQAAAVRATRPVEDFVRALTETPGQVPGTFLFRRGDPDQPKQAIAPGGLSILEERLPLSVFKEAGRSTTGRRLALARWLTASGNPLTSRVLVNRVWMHHFGKGLVASPSDFGKLGERPTHPELLDWLASEFVQRGWSLKHIHRLIMTSAAYRQASQRDGLATKVDPDNRLLSRMGVRRLEAEALRDSILAASGELHPRMFGPAVPVRENDVGLVVVGKGVKDLARGTTTEERLQPGEAQRRSIYIEVRRSMPLGMLETFDTAGSQPNCERRNSSTVPTQALMLMNNEFLHEQATLFAARLVREAGPEARTQVSRAWRLAYAAEPTAEEMRGALTFLTRQKEQFRAAMPAVKSGEKPKTPPDPHVQALGSLCHALLSSNRFLYVD
jgi:mono/diheme cytochrome c family protein